MKKLLSMILALALLLSVWSIPAVAEDGQAEEPAVAQEAAEEEAGEEEGELPEGTVLIVSEDPEPEEEEPVEEEPVEREPVEEEPVEEEPEAEEPIEEEPVEEEPVAEEPVEEEPVEEEPVEEPVKEEPVTEEPVEEEPVEEEPVEEEPVAEEPVEEEPVKEEPVTEEPVEEPVAEEPVEEEPVKEEPVTEEPVEEEPVKEEPVEEEPVKEEPVEEEPVAEAPVHFEQGYVTVKKGARAYTEASKKEEAGVFAADAVVYAEAEKQQDDPAKDWLKITFAVEKDGAPETAYIQAGSVKALEAGEAEALEAKLEKDAEAKEYKGHKLPFVTFVKVEEPVAEETVTKEAAERQLPVGEAEEETEEEVVEEAAPKATEKEAAPKQQETAPVKETAKVSASVTPRVASGKLNETVSFGVVCKNAADKVSYQWQSSSDGGKTWEDLPGNTGAALKVAVTEKNARLKYRCLVTTKDGTAASNACRINGTLSAQITPGIKAVNYGDTVGFRVQVSFATGAVKYQWQESEDNGKTWTDTKLFGRKSRTLKIPAKKASLPKKYRCVVKSGGEEAYSNTISIFGARIAQTSPRATFGDTVALSVKVFHRTSTAKYQWQVSTDKGATWQNTDKTGNKTKKLLVSCDTAEDLTNYYRCQVTCSIGTVYTNTVKFKGALSVNIQRNRTGASIGSTVKLISSVAFGSGTVSYTWQYSTDDGATWNTDTTMKGESPSLAVKEKQLTWLYRCVVSDKKKSATSNTVRLMDFTLGETKPVYRALLIGMENFYDDVCTRNRVDVEKMASLLGKATAPGGTKYKVTRKYDLGYDEVRQAIQTTFADTKETDVSLFMISTHGDSDNQGQLCCTPYYDMISFATLANWLNTYVQGKVVVILQSCGSGSAIYKEGVTENAVNAADEADAAFVEQAAAAFSAADKGVTEIVANMEYNAKGEPVAVNTGELRTSKFYVLAASRHHEMSWGDEDVEDPSKSGNYFIKWLIDGIGQRGSSPADTSPKNYVFTLEELFSYIKRFNTYAFYYQGKTYNQHVQRYPKNSKYPILMFP